MCRFLLAKSKKTIKPEPILTRFADMAQKSKTFDGDWQGDGWGVAWLNTDNEWQQYHSLKPVWQDREVFPTIPETTQFLIHARSASFEDQKGIVEYNQPYISGDYAFVFNGLLKGVSLPSSIPGKIGAQKIFSLLQNFLKKYDPQTSLEKVKALLIKSSKEIQALNIGLSDKKNIYALNHFTKHPECYTLQHFTIDTTSIISSENI